MAYDPLSDGDELTASHMLANIYDQVIAQVTSATRPAGTEGQVIYETDTGAYQAHDGSGYVENGRLTGATTWTPQVDQGVTTNIAKTVSTAFYIRHGNMVDAWTTLVMTASGTSGQNVTVTLPVTPVGYATNDVIGHAYLLDAGTAANNAFAAVCWVSTTVVNFRVSGAGVWGGSPSLQLVATDTLRVQVSYRVA